MALNFKNHILPILVIDHPISPYPLSLRNFKPTSTQSFFEQKPFIRKINFKVIYRKKF